VGSSAQPHSTDGRVSLKRRLVQAASWSLAGYAISLVLRLGSNLLLTRLLAPDMFGVMSVAYTVFTGLSMFSDVGLGPIIIQNKRGTEPKFLNVVWVTQIGRGVVVTAVALLLAIGLYFGWLTAFLPAQSVYSEPVVPSLIAVLSVMGIVTGLESTKLVLARRNLSFAKLTQIELITQVGATLFILAWAWVKPSVWALAWGWMFGAVLKTALTHLMLPGPSNRPEWDREIFAEVFRFGRWILVSSPLSFLMSSGDRILLASFLDAKTMGLYWIAFTLASILQIAVSRLSGSVMLPGLSEVARERPEELRTMLYRMRRPLDLACFGGAGLLLFLGPAVIRLLYDARYSEAGWILSVLGVALLAAPIELFDNALLAIGKPKLLSALNVVRMVSLYSAVPIGHHIAGARGAIYGVAASALVSVVSSWIVQRRVQLFSARGELLAGLLFLCGAAIGWLVAWGLRASGLG